MPAAPALATIDMSSGTRPFLKWPGGKRWLLRRGVRVPELSPDATYFEPFLGAGSLFFALQPANAVLSDVNPHLIATYRALKANAGKVISELRRQPVDESHYEMMRRARPRAYVDRAVRLIYLNRTAFAGIYRENRTGEFNVPYGGYTDRIVCQASVLEAAGRALQDAELLVGSFEGVEERAKPGDLVYLDPPYISGHQNNGFARYNRHLFTWDAQRELAALAKKLASRGVHILMSNTAHADLVALYRGFQVTAVTRHSQVPTDPKHRRRTKEVLIASYPGAVGRRS